MDKVDWLRWAEADESSGFIIRELTFCSPINSSRDLRGFNESQKPGRTLTRSDLKSTLSTPEVYRNFLKHCLEQDTSKDLSHFRKGLLEVVKSVGVTKISHKIGLSRLSIYRMLSKDGNPRLASLLALFKALGVHIWLVDEDFKRARQKVIRPKDVTSPDEIPKYLFNQVIQSDDGDLDLE